jgi:hypothetical protein
MNGNLPAALPPGDDLGELDAYLECEFNRCQFAHRADEYIRPRECIPLGGVEHVLDVDKDMKGRLRFPGREADLKAAG